MLTSRVFRFAFTYVMIIAFIVMKNNKTMQNLRSVIVTFCSKVSSVFCSLKVVK